MHHSQEWLNYCKVSGVQPNDLTHFKWWNQNCSRSQCFVRIADTIRDEESKCRFGTYRGERLHRELDQLEDDLISRANRLGTVTWQEFHDNQNLHSGKRVLIRSTDTNRGSLIILRPCVLSLTEDITLHPKPENNFRPDPEDPDYGTLAYILGFIAGIVIQSEEVVIEGNRHRLQQSKEYSLMQRAPFSLIETADQPFFRGQGPADFGPVMTSGSKIVIKDVYFGRTSHESIHGNSNNKVYIKDCTFQDYELAPVALNGGTRIVIRNCKALGNRRDVPVVGDFATALFIDRFAPFAVQWGDSNSKDTSALTAALIHLKDLIQEVRTDVVNADFINKDLHPEAYDLFANEAKVLDGNGYGFLINPKGFAVLGFIQDRDGSRALETHDVFFENVSVENVMQNIIEHPCLFSNLTNKAQTSISGGTLKISKLFDVNGRYKGSAVSDALILLADLVGEMPEEYQKKFHALNIEKPVRDWALRSTPENLADLITSGDFSYKRNGDTQFHVNKGLNIFRADGLSRAHYKNCLVKNIKNIGQKGGEIPLPGETSVFYTGASDGGHPDQGSQKGFNGSDLRGFSFAACENITLENITANNLSAINGICIGLDIFNYTNTFNIINYKCNMLEGVKLDYPLCKAICNALRIDKTSSRMDISGLVVGNDINPDTSSISINSTKEIQITSFDF